MDFNFGVIFFSFNNTSSCASIELYIDINSADSSSSSSLIDLPPDLFHAFDIYTLRLSARYVDNCSIVSYFYHK